MMTRVTKANTEVMVRVRNTDRLTSSGSICHYRALANAREVYTKKKKAGAKAIKASEATDKAIALAEKTTLKTLEKQQTKRNVIYQRRKTLWFEKFHWFLTSEKNLVVAGKDAHQNEQLVKRYLRKGDVYVHADLHGAASCIVRNHASTRNIETQELPPVSITTLEQAGRMGVCRSNARSSQLIAGAYWVHADQVSKTAPAGGFLTTGSFMIRGKKNYIQPSRLEMGLAILFHIDVSSVSQHARQNEERDLRVMDDFDERDGSDLPNVLPEEQEGLHQQDVAVEEKSEEATDDSCSEPRKSHVPADVAQGNEIDDRKDKSDPSKQEPQRDGRKRLSTRERRDLKKGVPTAYEDGAGDNSQPSYQAKQGQRKDTRKSLDKGNVQVSRLDKSVRGKKSKVKKMKKKYADQDDDDRRLRMEALGHVMEETDDGDSQRDQNSECVGQARDGGVDDEDDGSPVTSATTETKDEYIRQQREKKEKFLDEQEGEVESIGFFDAFTGEYLPNDIALFAMPICAPYASLSKFKYKVKLTPGSQKKGKAAKQAMGHFFAANLKEEKGMQKTQPDENPLAVQRKLMRLHGAHECKRSSSKFKKSNNK
ncbi:unnamed protein product [Hyaloperonospora brassicae]|uniref:NFACT RNA-binding domain-containing protein n=1 Tax=Hyaloperonospora brassicae TaxID=162125 RepID=A0AAV0TWJ3_HYABA|nr:unnamed protein product [Hyaloperonospora brassicae]